MKRPMAYAHGILHFFGVIRRNTPLRSLSFGGSDRRIHPWASAKADKVETILSRPETLRVFLLTEHLTSLNSGLGNDSPAAFSGIKVYLLPNS
jgi:hypothetical protein